MTSERSAENLIWIDLEFTNLDPTVGSIMQAAMIVTRADLTPLPPPGIPAEVGGLSFDVAIPEEALESISPWVRENQSAQVKRCRGEEALPVEKVEELFTAYLLATCEVPDDKRDRPLIAGNSVSGDLRYLQRHMPGLANLLSFRVLDVTTLKELARRWYPGQVFNKNEGTIRRWYPAEVEVKGEAHDALFDIKGSIAELNYYRDRLLRGPDEPAARAEDAQ